MRSLLFVPAHKEELIKKVFDTKADAVIFDLEDSCPGEKNREKGIRNISDYKKQINAITITRISNTGQIDLVDTDYIMLPKSEYKYYGFVSKKLILLIETALGIMNAGDLLTIGNVEGAAFGNEDYLADTGCSDYSFAQNMIVNACKSNDKFAIDSVNADVHNLDKLNADCARSVVIGFDGKLCINPKEIEVIHKWYTPTQELYEYSCRVIELYDQAEAEGLGVAIIEGVYVAPPMVKRAQKIIKKYETYIPPKH